MPKTPTITATAKEAAMPIAAVPKYLGQDFKKASPEMRFNQYFRYWTGPNDQEKKIAELRRGRSGAGLNREVAAFNDDREAIDYLNRNGPNNWDRLWQKNTSFLSSAYQEMLSLNEDDSKRLAALSQRQLKQAEQQNVYTVEAKAIAPFSTGLGNEHPSENGFAFLKPYGLPYLPGSSIKGVLRQAAIELAAGDWGDDHDWDDKALTLLFGNTPESTDARQGALHCWDVIPQLKGGGLVTEIMTPHQSHYLQNNETPHESGKITPLLFIAIAPESGFRFHVDCNEQRLRHAAHATHAAKDIDLGQRAAALLDNQHWKTLLQQALSHAFDWLGFGSKTRVGYGAMQIDETAQKRREAAQQEKQAAEQYQQALADMSPAERCLAETKKRLPEGSIAAGAQGYDLLKEAYTTATEQQWSPQEMEQLRTLLIQRMGPRKSWGKKAKDFFKF